MIDRAVSFVILFVGGRFMEVLMCIFCHEGSVLEYESGGPIEIIMSLFC